MMYLETLWRYILFSAPYLIFGLVVAGIIRSFLSVDIIKDKLGARSFKSVFWASLAGVPLPLCSCSVIPAAVTLKKSGASNGATSSFLISTPESGIDSIALTYSLMDLPMTILRPLVAFISAMTAGLFQNGFNQFTYVDQEESKKSCCHHDHEKSEKLLFKNKIGNGLKYAFTDLINDISWWLAIGLLLGAAIDFFVPANFFESLSGWTGRFIILGIGLPLYICASASTPIAASMVLKGLSPGAALIFLLVGPATNFSNIAVLQKYIGKKGIIINVIVISAIALISSYLVDNYYLGKMISWRVEEHMNHGNVWWEYVSAVLLIALLLRGIYVDKIKGLL